MEVKNFKVDLKVWGFKLAICILGVVLLGFSIAFTTQANLGTDPIAVFLNGVSIVSRLELGLATNLVSLALLVVTLFLDRKYINIGTIIYALLLGPSITWGVRLYELLSVPNEFVWRVTAGLFGCLLAYIGLGAYIAINIGVDPWSAFVLIIVQRTKKFNFGIIKLVTDLIIMIIGYLLGGKIGLITLFTAIVGGPSIQKCTEGIDKLISKMLKLNKSQ